MFCFIIPDKPRGDPVARARPGAGNLCTGDACRAMLARPQPLPALVIPFQHLRPPWQAFRDQSVEPQ